jgi:hypothetical protein
VLTSTVSSSSSFGKGGRYGGGSANGFLTMVMGSYSGGGSGGGLSLASGRQLITTQPISGVGSGGDFLSAAVESYSSAAGHQQSAAAGASEALSGPSVFITAW